MPRTIFIRREISDRTDNINLNSM